MLSTVSAFSSSTPRPVVRTTAARSATQAVPQTPASTRLVAAKAITPRSEDPVCGTTESSTSFVTRLGCASA